MKNWSCKTMYSVSRYFSFGRLHLNKLLSNDDLLKLIKSHRLLSSDTRNQSNHSDALSHLSASLEPYKKIEIDKGTFEQLSETLLQHLYEYFMNLIERENELMHSDVEYSNGVLTFKYNLPSKNKNMSWVINKQPPNHQIWLSSPISGPKRFDYSGGTHGWVYLREKAELLKLLEKELSSLLDKSIKII